MRRKWSAPFSTDHSETEGEAHEDVSREKAVNNL